MELRALGPQQWAALGGGTASAPGRWLVQPLVSTLNHEKWAHLWDRNCFFSSLPPHRPFLNNATRVCEEALKSPP